MRKICVITTTRAEYGIMSSLIKKIDEDSDLQLQLVVTGTHLSKKFGMTVDEISSPVARKIDINIEAAPAVAMALAVEKFTKCFEELRPDIVVLLGDRYELFAIAAAATLAAVPIAHIHGGEITQGAIDDVFRNAITKMSHIHFPCAREYADRIIQMGENPEKVFDVGSLAAENISKIKLVSKDDLEKSLGGFKFGKSNLLITFHPETLAKDSPESQFAKLLDALERLRDFSVIFTMPNSDSGADKIRDMITRYAKTRTNVAAYESLGMMRYLSAMKLCDAVVGNSSSGIIEAPAMRVPTVNIGDRQKGRIRAESVIDCPCDTDAIESAIRTACDDKFKRICQTADIAFYKPDTAANIVFILKNMKLEGILNKKFFDLPVGSEKTKR